METKERQAENERLYDVSLTLCGGCLDAQGAECHTPGCAFIRRSSPEWPLRGGEYDHLIVACAPQGIDGYCAKARKRMGPPHSDFGQSENGECGCIGCDGEDAHNYLTGWMDAHSEHCTPCRAERLKRQAIPGGAS